MKNGFKILCLVLVALLAAGALGCFVLFGTHTDETEDLDYYRAISGETDGPNTLAILGEQIDISDCPYGLPTLSQLEPYEDCRFNYTVRRVAFFESHAYLLILEYTEGEYEERKGALEGEYTWLSEQIPGETEGLRPEFEVDGFHFRAVEGGQYPKQMLLIGTSDEGSEIAYLYFRDMDLDYIGHTMEDFLREETGWSRAVE